jgi:hypothetical protein
MAARFGLGSDAGIITGFDTTGFAVPPLRLID